MKITQLKTLVPELFLIVSVLYYWVLTPIFFNPIAIMLLVVFIYQIVTKNSITGLIIASVFLLLTLYMSLALVSELSEFEVHNDKWRQLAVFGWLFIGLNLILAGAMFLKYIKLKIN